MFSNEHIEQVLNGTVVDNNGDKIGKVGDVYNDDRTGNPSWVTVNTGLFGTSNTFIPLDDAQVDGDTIRVPFSKDKVKDAPRVDADRHLDADEERELYRYYGHDYDEGYAAAGTRGGDHGADAGWPRGVRQAPGSVRLRRPLPPLRRPAPATVRPRGRVGPHPHRV